MFICYIYRHLCFDNVYMPMKNLNLNLNENFYYGNSEIECVKEIQYLGFNITHNMNIKNLITDRHKKSRENV